MSFEKLMLLVREHGRYKRIIFKDQFVNFVVSYIGWANLCNSTNRDFLFYKQRFDDLLEFAKASNKKSGIAFIPVLDVYETVIL